ncbi:MAG: hypothetical protein H7Y37_01010 [Anaerolineae bacterium]|nr:hypothetical protein [Gloeobacterales cyanobacterium ES-bin-313]
MERKLQYGITLDISSGIDQQLRPLSLTDEPSPPLEKTTTRRIEGNSSSSNTLPILANNSHPSKSLRAYTLAIHNERSGEAIQDQEHRHQ